MNNYLTLKKANRLRMKLVSETSQKQIREVIHYLRRVSWDFCGIAILHSDLIDLAVQANEEGRELFNVITDAETFVQEVKPSLKVLTSWDYFWFIAPLYFFFAWGVEGLLLYPLAPDWVFEFSVGYLMQLAIALAAFCWLFRRMMEQVGFPPSEHRMKYLGWLALYIVVLYGTGWFFTKTVGSLVLLRLPCLPYALFSLLLGAGLYWVHFWRYGKDSRLQSRL